MVRAGRRGERAKALSLGWGEDTDPRTAPLLPGEPGAYGTHGVTRDVASGDSADLSGASAGGSHADRPRQRLSPRTRRVLAIGLALALVGALTVGLPRLISTTGDPEQVATDFLQAIVDGDMEQVRAHVEDAPDASDAALTAEILESATGRLEYFTVDDVDVSAGTATVTVTLGNGDRTSTARLDLTSRSDSAFAPVRWDLAPVHLPEFLIDVPVGVQEVLINGEPVSVTDLVSMENSYSPQVALQLLPGTYEITVADPGPWQEAPRVALEAPPVLGTWRKPIHDLQLDLDEAGRQQVQERMGAELEECLRSTSSLVEDCPFAVSEPGDGEPPPPESPEGPGEPEDEETLRAPDGPGTWTLREPPEIDVHPMGSFLWSVSATAVAEFTATDAEGVGEESAERVRIDAESIAYIGPDGQIRLESMSSSGFGYTYCTDSETGIVNGIAVSTMAGEWNEDTDPCAAGS